MPADKIISQVRPKLCIGNIFAAGSKLILSANEIKGVVCLKEWGSSPEDFYRNLGISWRCFFLHDHESFKDKQKLLVSDIFPWIKQMETSGNAILIHCEMGISRSSACMITYLVWDGMSFTEAFKLVAEKHPITAPSLLVMESFLECIGVNQPDLAEILIQNYERAMPEIEKMCH